MIECSCSVNGDAMCLFWW